jgi:CRISPR-associated protein Cse1 (CRISPR_cse1)
MSIQILESDSMTDLYNVSDSPYNLLTQPCIRVMYQDKIVSMTLVDVFKNAQDIKDIAPTSAEQYTAIMRVLEAIAYRVTGLDGDLSEFEFDDLRADLLEEGSGFDAEIVNSYFDTYNDRFDLIHPEKPFMQNPDIDLSAMDIKPADAFMDTMSTMLKWNGKNRGTTSFNGYYNEQEEYTNFNPEQALSLLLVGLLFRAGDRGGAPVSEKTGHIAHERAIQAVENLNESPEASFNGRITYSVDPTKYKAARLRNTRSVHLLGVNLYQTLLINLVPSWVPLEQIDITGIKISQEDQVQQAAEWAVNAEKFDNQLPWEKDHEDYGMYSLAIRRPRSTLDALIHPQRMVAKFHVKDQDIIGLEVFHSGMIQSSTTRWAPLAEWYYADPHNAGKVFAVEFKSKSKEVVEKTSKDPEVHHYPALEGALSAGSVLNNLESTRVLRALKSESMVPTEIRAHISARISLSSSDQGKNVLSRIVDVPTLLNVDNQFTDESELHFDLSAEYLKQFWITLYSEHSHHTQFFHEKLWEATSEKSQEKDKTPIINIMHNQFSSRLDAALRMMINALPEKIEEFLSIEERTTPDMTWVRNIVVDSALEGIDDFHEIFIKPRGKQKIHLLMALRREVSRRKMAVV